MKYFRVILVLLFLIGLGMAQYYDTSRPHKTYQGAEYVGTGFFVADQVILTARHVIAGNGAIYITFRGHSYPGIVIAQDRGSDLALVRINTGSFTPYAQIGNAYDHETVLLKGYDLGEPILKSHRVIFSFRDNQNGLNAVRTTGETCQGDSGGPSIDSNNQVVGVTDQGSIESQDVTQKGCSRLSWLVKPEVIRAFLQRNHIVGQNQASTVTIVYIENIT